MRQKGLWRSDQGSLSGNIGIPGFFKVCFMPLCFYERPTLVPFFTNQKKFEEDFHFDAQKFFFFDVNLLYFIFFNLNLFILIRG